MQNKIDSIFDEPREHITKRVTLKPQIPEDFDIYYKLWTNDDVLYFLERSQKTEEELQKLYDSILAYSEKKYFFKYIIFLKDTNEKIGSFGINAINKLSSRVDIGYLLLPEYWSRGIISEVIEMMLEYLFIEIKLNKICATSNYDNIASRKVLEKFGFEVEGILKEQTYIGNLGKFCDDAKYGLLREEWENEREK